MLALTAMLNPTLLAAVTLNGATILPVVLFCVIQAMFLELPLVGYAVSPGRTQRAVDGSGAGCGRGGGRPPQQGPS